MQPSSNEDKDKSQDRLDIKSPKIPDETNHIGVQTTIRFVGFNGDAPIPAKVDTGAEMSSLHAEDLEVITNDVTQDSTAVFNFGERKYRIPVDGFQSVTSANGTSNRPIVTFNVLLNNNFHDGVQFNLSDRSDMEFPVLIGLNLIQKAKLVVDPSLKEMEIEFRAPVGGAEAPAGDTLVDKNDVPEEDSDSTADQLLQWYQANKDKTLAELIGEFFNRSSVDDTNV